MLHFFLQSNTGEQLRCLWMFCCPLINVSHPGEHVVFGRVIGEFNEICRNAGSNCTDWPQTTTNHLCTQNPAKQFPWGLPQTCQIAGTTQLFRTEFPSQDQLEQR